MENDLLQRGIAAIKAGDKAEARRLLGRVIQQNPRDEQAWLWMSGAVDTAQDRLTCLTKALEINPNNEAAQRGLATLQKRLPDAPVAPIETQPVPRPKPTLVQAVLGTALPAAEQIPTPGPANASANAAVAYPYVKVGDMLDHSKSLDELDPEKRKALEGFVPLIARDLTVNHMRPEEIIERITSRGFSRQAVEQVVREVAHQPIRAPIRYERRLTKEQFESLPSPWLTMWTKPRETMRRIVYYDPKRDVHLLAALQGFVLALMLVLYMFLSIALVSNISYEVPEISEGGLSNLPSISFTALAIAIGICAIIGPIAGLINLYLYGWLLRVTGRWLGGTAYPVEVRAALAWSAVPRLWGAILLVLQLVLIVYVLYANAVNSYISTSTLLVTLGILFLVQFVISVWELIVFLKCLGEVHGFSAWKALVAGIISVAIVYVVNTLISCIFNALAGTFLSSLLALMEQ
ncbi:MAG: YIP1 family protein [Anaerolineae bacterium]|nr:YIP1 family protein [Anaerolineae bacterium]